MGNLRGHLGPGSDAVAAVPTNRPENDLAGEVPPPEHGHQPPSARYLPAVPCRAQAIFATVPREVLFLFSCVLTFSRFVETRALKRIGIIVAGLAYPMEGFKSGLRDLGVEGESVCFEIRAAEGQLHLLPGFASELVGLGLDLIAVIGAVTVRAVRQITTRIPVVFAVVVEPIGDELVTNLERPGGNITGITTFDPHQAKTQLELLRAIIPDLRRVAILSDLGVSDCMSRSNREAAHGLQLEPQVIRVEAPSPEYKKAFAAMEHERAQALVVLEEPINQACRKEIADLAAARRLPTVFPISMLDAGSLLAYGTSLREAARHMARYANQILRGASPGDLAIEAALSHELVVNLQAAWRVGVTVPPEVLARADHVI